MGLQNDFIGTSLFNRPFPSMQPPLQPMAMPIFPTAITNFPMMGTGTNSTSTMTTTVNGVTRSVKRTVDGDGNVTEVVTNPDGSQTVSRTRLQLADGNGGRAHERISYNEGRGSKSRRDLK
jgi:hypothetical protein